MNGESMGDKLVTATAGDERSFSPSGGMEENSRIVELSQVY